jgi:hypothetical protein
LVVAKRHGKKKIALTSKIEELSTTLTDVQSFPLLRIRMQLVVLDKNLILKCSQNHNKRDVKEHGRKELRCQRENCKESWCGDRIPLTF